jgi:hypothetical protein
MKASHQRCDGGQRSIELRPHRERGNRHVTLDEHKPLTAVIVDTDRHRSTVEARVAQRREEAVDQARVRVRGPKHMLTKSRHTTGIRHAPRQWYFIHPVIIAGTVSAPSRRRSVTRGSEQRFSIRRRKAVESQPMRTDPTGLAVGVGMSGVGRACLGRVLTFDLRACCGLRNVVALSNCLQG